MARIPLIIDSDPGLGDAVAIAAALCSPALDVKALTVVAGQQGIESTLQNALDIADYLGTDIEVARGAERPLFRTLVSAHKGGDADLGVFNKHIKKPSPRSALEALRNTLTDSPRRVTLLVLGPLTNIAQVLLAYPDVKSKIERVVAVGGAVVGGNVTPAAEFNMFVDPEAAEAVFNSQVPITMIGLEQSHKFCFTKADYNALAGFNNKTAEIVFQAVGQMQKAYRELNWGNPALNEVLGVLYLTNPEWFSVESYRVDVEAKGNLTRGMTVVDVHGVTGREPNASVVTAVDRDACMKAFLDTIKNDAQKPQELD